MPGAPEAPVPARAFEKAAKALISGYPAGPFGGADRAGEVYSMQLDFTQLTDGRIGGTLDVLYDGNSDPDQLLRSPNNVDWADDGFVYVQEDPAAAGLFGEGALRPAPPGIVRIYPTGGSASRIVDIVRDAILPAGAVDEPAVDWENSGILERLDAVRTSRRLLAISCGHQAHSLVNQHGRGVTTGPAALLSAGGLVEGGSSAS